MNKPSGVSDLQFRSSEWLWVGALVSALLMTLLDGEWRWIAGIGWVVLAVLLTLNQHFIFYALLFFAPWFHPTGYMTHLIFSLKHFQTVFFLALIVQAIGGNLIATLEKGIKPAKFLCPLLVILLIGLVNFFRFNESIQMLRTPANVMLTLLILFYLFGIWESLGQAKTRILKNGLNFFIFSVVIQIVVALQNTIAGTFIFNTPLIHNNHLGILCAFSSFYALGLFLTEKKGLLKNIYGTAMTMIIAATIVSCSRTSWLGFLISMVCFFVLMYRHCHKSTVGIKKRHALYFASGLAGLILLIYWNNSDVQSRICGLIPLFSLNYWKYTFSDFQNFGFLGIFRLQQIYDLKIILQQQPILGMGFMKQIVDFHGFYFCLLGASGFAGLLIFAGFVRSVLTRLLATLQADHHDDGLFFLRLSAFCAFLVWLFCSFLESFYVQFAAWITVYLAIISIHSSEKS